MQSRSEFKQTRALFLLGAGFVIAHQVAGKAVRDGLFLSQFAASDLPKVIVLAALVAVMLGVAFTRLLSRFGPLRFVPGAFAASAILHLAELALLRSSGNALRAAVVTLVYLHLVGFGAVLLSGFWSMAGEVFDPRSAKREFGRIAAFGTAGGVLGGLLAERGAAFFGVESLLTLLAILNFGAWLTMRSVAAANHAPVEPQPMSETWEAVRGAFRQAPFLVNLGALVLLGTVSATLLDYLFKSSAASAYQKGPELTRYFALFYSGTQILTFLVQNFVTPKALRRLGLARTMQSHFVAIGAGAGASLFLAPFVMAPVARAFELIFRGSFFRSSYELFFTPAPPREKRAIKTFVDVSCDRAGDAAGAGILQLLLLAGPTSAPMLIAIAGALFSAAAFWITRRMDTAYSNVLERGLVNRAIALKESSMPNSLTLGALLHVTETFAGATTWAKATRAPDPGIRDPLLSRLADLRSGSPKRIQAALAPQQPFDAAVVPLAIRLLAWRESFEMARAFLLRDAHRATGQLLDALLDPEQDFAVRRRIPQILAYTSSQRAVDGLIKALEDPRFEIRFHSSRALEFLYRMTEGLHFDQALLISAVERELASSREIWRHRKLLDNPEATPAQAGYLDDVVRGRADKSLEHVFNLLAMLLPAEPLRIAFRGLHSEDRMLRALALEFLESHLSPVLVSNLRRLVDAPPTAMSAISSAASKDEVTSAIGELA
jgi:ATP:ADP antiporter, AAA family